ncbi:MAG: hypothetical protein OWS74_05360 [Firmicutes bacterium]|nr:hypothetical protein [Bacillota bacterium]
MEQDAAKKEQGHGGVFAETFVAVFLLVFFAIYLMINGIAGL